MQKTSRGTIVYDKGEVIIKEGNTGKAIYFLISGKIGVYKGKKLIGVIDKPNSPIGEISAILGTKRTATCIALERSEVAVYKGGIDEIIAKYPKTTKAIIVNLAERVAKSTQKISEIKKEEEEEKKEEERIEENFSDISDIPPEKLSGVISLLSEKELALLMAESEKFKEKISKLLSSRKFQSIQDLVEYYSRNGVSQAEIEVVKQKVEDIISAISEEEA